MLCNFNQCFRPFNMLTVYKCSYTRLFTHLSNPAFAVYNFQKQINSEAHPLFQSIQNFM